MLEQKIEILTKAIEALTAALQENRPADAPQPKIVEASAPPIVTHAPAPAAISEQDLKDITLAKSRAGHKDAIRAKLDALNAKKITDLKGDDAAAFYDWLVAL